MFYPHTATASQLPSIYLYTGFFPNVWFNLSTIVGEGLWNPNHQLKSFWSKRIWWCVLLTNSDVHTQNYSPLEAFIWWLSNPPKVSALLGSEMGPTPPSWSMAVLLTCCPRAVPRLLFTRSCSSSTEKCSKVFVKAHLRFLSCFHPCLSSGQKLFGVQRI